MTLTHNAFTALLGATSLVLLSGYNACDPIIENNGFDLWCGDRLCSWELEKGEVVQVPTWHNNDFGVDMRGDMVAISQVSDVASKDNVSCLSFSLVANIAATATVRLELDFHDDGVIDYEQPIPTSSWAPIRYLVPLPERYSGIRFRITKEGSGEAVLAQIAAADSAECTAPPITLRGQGLGALCAGADGCASDLCTNQTFGFGEAAVCSECGPERACSGDLVCGAEVDANNPLLGFYWGCAGGPGRHALGERCISNDECATGLCAWSVCSTCVGNGGCEPGQTCGKRETADAMVFWIAPFQCDPGQGGTRAGDPCLIDSDCAGGACRGGDDFKVCLLDGRRCGSPDDCPGNIDCVTIGTTGGQCQ